jgi:hypothetical protein
MILIEFIYYRIYKFFKEYNDDAEFKALLITTILLYFNFLEIWAGFYLLFDVPFLSKGEIGMERKLVVGGSLLLLIGANYFLLMRNNKTKLIEKRISNTFVGKKYLGLVIFSIYILATFSLMIYTAIEVRVKLMI